MVVVPPKLYGPFDCLNIVLSIGTITNWYAVKLTLKWWSFFSCSSKFKISIFSSIIIRGSMDRVSMDRVAKDMSGFLDTAAADRESAIEIWDYSLIYFVFVRKSFVEYKNLHLNRKSHLRFSCSRCKVAAGYTRSRILNEQQATRYHQSGFLEAAVLGKMWISAPAPRELCLLPL